MKRALLAAALCLSAAVANANESAPAPTKGDPAKGQVIGATVCAACHGADGNSAVPVNPSLAGQHPEYLHKQMMNFKAIGDKQPERVNPIMNGMIAAFDEVTLRDVAAYFAAQKRNPNPNKPAQVNAVGQKLWRAGDLDKGIPACSGCHGPAAAGIPAQFPALAAQHVEYTEGQLKAFRDGARANDPNKMMRMIALKMTDAEIKAVAEYVAALK